MTVFSKRFQLVEHLPCSAIHPWTDSCSYNVLGTFLQTLKGSTKFFLLIYLFQIALKRSSRQKEVLAQQAVSFLRSCMFGAFCGSASVAGMCFLRWLLGKYTTYSLGLIPGMIGGGGIFIETSSRRSINLTLLIALVADLYLKVFQDDGLLIVSLPLKQIIFTISSCLLLYSLRAVKGSYTVLWPFTPHRVHEDDEKRKKCPHKGKCLDDITKTSSTYFCYGLALRTFKVAALHFNKLFHKPTSFLTVFFKLKNLQLPLFAGLYVFLFKGVSCLLCQHRGRDEAWHALPAGAVASLCYLIQPNLSLALFALSNLSQIVCRKYRKKIGLPEWPWEEMVFMVCMGLLYHARAAHPHCFPSYMFKIMDTATDGRAQTVYGLVDQHLMLRF